MSYCVHCGVELSDYHKQCPLCKTMVINPNLEQSDIDSDYPNYRENPISEEKRIRRILTGIILSVQFFVYSLLTLFIDILTSGGVSWSLIPIISLLLLLFTVAYPFFRKNNTFFKLFTFDCIAVGIYLLLLNLIISNNISWASYTSYSILMLWIIIAGIFLTNKIRKFLPITFYYIFSGFIMSLLATFFIGNQHITISIIASISVTALALSLISYFVIKAATNSVLGLIMVLLFDVSIICIVVDLSLHYYLYSTITISWSIIVNAVTLPLASTIFAIKRSEELREMISKKLHR